jgi:hypothetical protein
VAILVGILFCGGLGFAVEPGKLNVGLPGLQDEPWFWPVAGVAVGVLFGVLVGAATVLTSPKTPSIEPTTVVALTPHTLPGFLTQMGYEHEARRLPSGDLDCIVTVRRDGWNVMISVNISPNRANLWLTMALGEIPPNTNDHATRFLRLLQASWETAPAFFACHRMSNALCLMRSLENRSVSPAVFRQAMDDLIAEARRMAAWWDIANWQRPVGWQPSNRSTPSESQDITPAGRDITGGK